mgnify:CR=1 FL=1
MPSTRFTSALFVKAALWTCLVGAGGLGAAGCQDAGPGENPPAGDTLAQTLFVGHEGTFQELFFYRR